MFYLDTTSDIQAFEANSKGELQQQVAECSAQDGENICQIESVYFEAPSGKTTKLSHHDLYSFIEGCEALNQSMIQEAEAEAKADRENTSDYYASIL